MCPLPMAHTLVGDEEQSDGSAEHFVVARESSEPPEAVGAGNLQQSVHVLTQLVATSPIRLPQIRWVHWTLDTLVGAFGGLDSPRELDDPGAVPPRHGNHFPGL